jgi:nitrite reductase (NADH) large subunit
MSAPQRLVVVGNGMAAVRTLEHLMQIAPGRHSITVFGAEPHASYNRILLSPVLAGEIEAASIVTHDAAWFARHGIDLRLGRRVEHIDRAHSCVIDETRAATAYDRLLLATGSEPVRLPIPGSMLGGVITYRDLADTQAMIAASARHKRAVVIGGGLLGLEAANGLAARGMEVSVVHLMPSLMERQLDEHAGAVLRRGLEARGIRFYLGCKTLAISGTDGEASGVIIEPATPSPSEAGITIPAELVVMAVGIKPNTSLAQTAGLQVDRGILVDDTLLTYDPRIYAVGECVRHRGRSYGLVQPLYEMARVCATHLAGVGSHFYSGSAVCTHLKVTGIEVFSAGDFADVAGRENLVVSDPTRGIYRRLVVDNDRLVGSVLVGDSRGAARYSQLIRTKASVAPLRRELMFLQ